MLSARKNGDAVPSTNGIAFPFHRPRSSSHRRLIRLMQKRLLQKISGRYDADLPTLSATRHFFLAKNTLQHLAAALLPDLPETILSAVAGMAAFHRCRDARTDHLGRHPFRTDNEKRLGAAVDTGRSGPLPLHQSNLLSADGGRTFRSSQKTALAPHRIPVHVDHYGAAHRRPRLDGPMNEQSAQSRYFPTAPD